MTDLAPMGDSKWSVVPPDISDNLQEGRRGYHPKYIEQN